MQQISKYISDKLFAVFCDYFNRFDKAVQILSRGTHFAVIIRMSVPYAVELSFEQNRQNFADLRV